MSKLKSIYKRLSTAERAAIIAGFIGIVSTIIVSITQIYTHHHNSNSSKLELVDVIWEDTTIPELGIKLRNIRKKVAFIKSVEFNVKSIYIIECPYVYDAVAWSWKYDVYLPTKYSPPPYGKEAPYVEQVKISQSIKPNDVDYFRIRFGNLPYNPNIVVYFLNICLNYNEDDQIIVTNPLIILLPASAGVGRYLPLTKEEKEIWINHDDNLNTIKMLKELEGIKSKTFLELIEN